VVEQSGPTQNKEQRAGDERRSSNDNRRQDEGGPDRAQGVQWRRRVIMVEGTPHHT
jgi:hypothetical protein